MHRAVLDALVANVAILGDDGTVRFVNRRWVEFGRENGDTRSAEAWLGQNYFSICESCEGPDARFGHRVVNGLRAVAAGEIPLFEIEYPCHAPHRERWFLLQASRIGDSGPDRLLVVHSDISAQKEFALAFSENRIRVLIEAQRNREADFLKHLSDVQGLHMTPGLLGVVPLREADASVFRELCDTYVLLIEQAVEERLYRVEHGVSAALRSFARDLGAFHASPRDVIDLHSAVSARLAAEQRLSQAHDEELRLRLLEFMGCLTAYYRLRSFGNLASGKPFKPMVE
jgi:hypothetical protein